MALCGKGATLLALAGRLRSARVPDSILLTSEQWLSARGQALGAVQGHFGPCTLAVRSDAHDEDGVALTRAGAYATRLDVDLRDTSALAAAIDAVFEGYGGNARENRVLLQPMVADVRACYVAATHTLDELAPYYALSFTHGARSDAVTRGDRAVHTWYIARDGVDSVRDADANCVLHALQELESIFGVPLECEIVLSGAEAILLQVRRIVVPAGRTVARGDPTLPRRMRAAAAALVRERASDALLGELRLYGQMPDWNPAELLGAHPRPLALSLFRALIARRAWCEARAALGYRAFPARDLLLDIAGRPFVDVRLSFNSFLPAGIAAGLGARLVDAWSQRLAAQPELHDKVEFAVATTCVDFNFGARCAEQLEPRERAAYQALLLAPTQACLDARRLDKARAQLATLNAAATPKPDSEAALRSALVSAEAAAPYFAGVARQAFAADALLRSAVTRGALKPARFDQLRASLATARGALLQDWPQDGSDASARTCWLERYGHLRPGTFEISVPSYADRAAALWAVRAPRACGAVQEFTLDSHESYALDALCAETALGVDARALVAFHRASAGAREFGKFVLSRCVSQLLDAFATRGCALGVPRQRLTWLTLDALLALVSGTSPPSEALAIAQDAEHRYERERLLKLPPLIAAGDELALIRLGPGMPNFLGRGVVQGAVATIDAHTLPGTLRDQQVVVIERADPGFDWIFAHAPLALVTAYGGPNSHMAIRCAETGCRAVLGCGPERYAQVARAPALRIDFDAQALEPAR
jgi:hypothetical protein